MCGGGTRDSAIVAMKVGEGWRNRRDTRRRRPFRKLGSRTQDSVLNDTGRIALTSERCMETYVPEDGA